MIFSVSENDKESFGIYGIKNLQNNKVYVGQTGESFQRRFWHHRWKLKDGSHDNSYLQNAWNKYGEKSFEFFIIQVVTNTDELDDLEIKFIQLYKDLNLSYNILSGGGGRRGVPMSDHAKEIVGGKNREHMLGKRHSEETKAKMSQTRTGQTYNHYKVTNVLNDDLAREIKMRLINGEKATEIAKSLNVSYNSVNGILSNNTWDQVFVEGWEEFRRKRKTYSRKNLTKEEHAEIYNMYVNQHISSKQIAEQYGCAIGTVTRIIKQQLK